MPARKSSKWTGSKLKNVQVKQDTELQIEHIMAWNLRKEGAKKTFSDIFRELVFKEATRLGWKSTD